jgi:hypothetical protein
MTESLHPWSKTNMKTVIILLLCVGLYGCATPQKCYSIGDELYKKTQELESKRDAALNTWIGENESSLIASWGSPTEEINKNNLHIKQPLLGLIHNRDPLNLANMINNGKKIIIYTVHGKVVIGGPKMQTTDYSGYIGNTPYSGTSSAMIDKPFETLEVVADTAFIIDGNGKIEQWEDYRMNIPEAWYPPIKPSKKAIVQSPDTK